MKRLSLIVAILASQAMISPAVAQTGSHVPAMKSTIPATKIQLAKPIVFGDGFTYVTGKPSGDILATGSGRTILLAPDGTIKWEHPAKNNADAWYLPNGNVLFADGAVYEVTPDHKTIWTYTSKEMPRSGAFSCQRLPNGNTLIGENSTGIVMELDKDKNVVSQFKIPLHMQDRHHTMRYVRKLDNGNILVCRSGLKTVVEYTPQGEVVWEQSVKGGIAFSAFRMADGTTFISSLDRVERYAKDNALVWSFHKDELPELHIRNMTGLHVLPNGNILIGCYAAYHQGKGTGMFEITPEKKLVWAYRSPKFRDVSMMGVQLIDKDNLTHPNR